MKKNYNQPQTEIVCFKGETILQFNPVSSGGNSGDSPNIIEGE